VIPKFGQEEEHEDKRNKVEMERKATFEMIGGLLHIFFYNYLNCFSYLFTILWFFFINDQLRAS